MRIQKYLPTPRLSSYRLERKLPTKDDRERDACCTFGHERLELSSWYLHEAKAVHENRIKLMIATVIVNSPSVISPLPRKG